MLRKAIRQYLLRPTCSVSRYWPIGFPECALANLNHPENFFLCGRGVEDTLQLSKSCKTGDSFVPFSDYFRLTMLTTDIGLNNPAKNPTGQAYTARQTQIQFHIY